jgi:hypothetical protein
MSAVQDRANPSGHSFAESSILKTRNFSQNVLCTRPALEFSHGQDPTRTWELSRDKRTFAVEAMWYNGVCTFQMSPWKRESRYETQSKTNIRSKSLSR